MSMKTQQMKMMEEGSLPLDMGKLPGMSSVLHGSEELGGLGAWEFGRLNMGGRHFGTS